jgi:hypothetical protein
VRSSIDISLLAFKFMLDTPALEDWSIGYLFGRNNLVAAGKDIFFGSQGLWFVVSRHNHVMVSPQRTVARIARFGVVDGILAFHFFWFAILSVYGVDRDELVGNVGLIRINGDRSAGHRPDDFAASPARMDYLLVWIAVIEIFVMDWGSRLGFAYRRGMVSPYSS